MKKNYSIPPANGRNFTKMTSLNLGDKKCHPKRRLAKDFLWEYVTDNNPGCPQPTLLVSVYPRTLKNLSLPDHESHICSSACACIHEGKEGSTVAAGLSSSEQFAELLNEPANLNRHDDRVNFDVIKSSNLDCFFKSIIFLLLVDIPPRFSKRHKRETRKKFIPTKKSIEKRIKIQRSGVQKLGVRAKINIISNTIPVTVNLIEGFEKHPAGSHHVRCRLGTVYFVRMTLSTRLRLFCKNRRMEVKGLHANSVFFPEKGLCRSKTHRLYMSEDLHKHPNRISRNRVQTNSVLPLSVAKVKTKVSARTILPWTSVETSLTLTDPLETRLTCSNIHEENMSQFVQTEEERYVEDSLNHQSHKSGKSYPISADLHPFSCSFGQQTSNTCLANDHSREIILSGAPDIPLLNKNCETARHQTQATNNQGCIPAEKYGNGKKLLGLDSAANALNNGTLTESEKRRLFLEKYSIIGSNDKSQGSMGNRSTPVIDKFGGYRPTRANWPRASSMVNPERWRPSPVIKCPRESCVFFDRLTKEATTAHPCESIRACQLGVLYQLFNDNAYTCNLEKPSKGPIKGDGSLPKSLKTVHVKYVGTQTRDTQRPAVQILVEKEQHHPSSTDVDAERKSRSSNNVTERDCRLTRHRVESLKKACLVLEKELAGICRSPDPASEQGEDIQVNQVRADISHLQKKLMHLSHAQKKRAAVLDQAVRLVNQMSRIGSQSNMSHRIRCSSWTPESEDSSNGSARPTRKLEILSPRTLQMLSPHQVNSKATNSRSDFHEASTHMKDHYKRLQIDEAELHKHQREAGLPKRPVLKCATQKGQTDGRLASFKCPDIPKTHSSLPSGKSTVRSPTSQIPHPSAKPYLDRSLVQRSLPLSQLKQGEKRPITSSGYGNSVAFNVGHKRSFASQSTNFSHEMRNEDQAGEMPNLVENPFELIKQKIESLQYRRACLRKILQEVTDRKHRLFKREDIHEEKPALEKKQKELAETLENVQREMEELQQSIQKRRN